jgi:hypothetical protein
MKIIKSIKYGDRIYGPGDEQDLIDAVTENQDGKKAKIDWTRLAEKNVIDEAPGAPPKGSAKAVLNDEKPLNRMSRAELAALAESLSIEVVDEDTKATLTAKIEKARERSDAGQEE